MTQAERPDLRALPPRAQALHFLETLFGSGPGFVELSAFERGRGGAVVQRWYWCEETATLLSDAAPLVPSHDVYVGVALRREHGAGGKAGILSTSVMWADLDCGGAAEGHRNAGRHQTKRDALSTLSALPEPPTLVLDSGGGLHAYWELTEALPLATREEQDVAEAILRRLAAATKGDPAVCEVARIMRLPGTINHKTSPGREVVLLRHDRREVDLDALLETLPPDPGRGGVRPAPADGSTVRHPSAPAEGDRERLRRLVEALFLPCMQRLAAGHGWQEGEGHAIRLRAACHLRHYGLPREAAEPLLLLLDPTIADSREAQADLAVVLESVYAGRAGEGYAGLGCEDGAWTSAGRRCGDAQRAVCPLWAQEHRDDAQRAALAAVEAAHAAIPEDAAGSQLLLLLAPVYDAIAAVPDPTLRDACVADVVARYRKRAGALKVASVAQEVARRIRKGISVAGAPREQVGPGGLRVPFGWRLEGERCARLYRVSYGPDGAELGKEIVSERPPILLGRLQDVNTGDRQLECTFDDPPGQGRIVATRSSWATAIGLGRLADLGLPVHAGNARALTAWIDAQETANADRLPQQRSTSRFGWHDGDLFVLGDETLGPGGTSAPLRFVADGAGEERTAEALRTAGTEEEWLRVVLPLALAYPRLLLCVVAALATPLMEAVDAPVFLLELIGESSVGKTTAAQAALSAWGDPVHSGIRRTFWATVNSHERYLAAVGNGLPAMLDDSQNVPKPEQAVSTAYWIGNGQGKGRAAPSGSRIVATWRTVCFVTGERGLESYGSLTGVAARLLSFSGSPFGGHQPDHVSQLLDCVTVNHGHAGRTLVRWLLRQSDWRARVRALYSKTVKRLRGALPGDKIMARRLPYVALLVAAAVILDRVFRWPLRESETLAERVEEALVRWAEEQPVRDQPRETHEAFLDYVQQMRARFLSPADAARAPDERDTKERLGVWGERGEDRASVVKILPSAFRAWARANSYDPNLVLSQWRERGLLDLPVRDGKRLAKQVRMGGALARMYVIRLTSGANEDEDEDSSGGAR